PPTSRARKAPSARSKSPPPAAAITHPAGGSHTMNATDRPKAYSYARFSHPEQAKGDSLGRQGERARAYAETHGLELDTELTFEDLGVSAYRGANVETGRLGEFLIAVQQGIIKKGSYLLIENLDRLSRNKARKATRLLED